MGACKGHSRHSTKPRSFRVLILRHSPLDTHVRAHTHTLSHPLITVHVCRTNSVSSSATRGLPSAPPPFLEGPSTSKSPPFATSNPLLSGSSNFCFISPRLPQKTSTRQPPVRDRVFLTEMRGVRKEQILLMPYLFLSLPNIQNKNVVTVKNSDFL